MVVACLMVHDFFLVGCSMVIPPTWEFVQFLRFSLMTDTLLDCWPGPTRATFGCGCIWIGSCFDLAGAVLGASVSVVFTGGLFIFTDGFASVTSTFSGVPLMGSVVAGTSEAVSRMS